MAATDRTDAVAFFSNEGRHTVHVGAPGDKILSTIPGNLYATFSGTSMATPHVTGLAALLKAQDPSRDWRAIKNLIFAGGDDIVSLINTITQKRLNAYGALTCNTTSLNSVVLSRLRPISNTISGSVGTPINLSALHIKCADPNGDVTVTVDPGGQTVTLQDKGLNSDQDEGDGIYSGQWTPSATGIYTLTFPDGDAVTVEVVLTVGPDLIISTFSAPSTAGTGTTITVTDTTKNQGTEDATAASTTSFYFSTNGTFDNGDTLLGSRTVPALASGVSNPGSVTVTLPPGLSTGTYYLLAKTDAGNGVGETNESNNVAVRSIQLGPDLILSVFSAPSTAAAGATLSLSDTTKNQGGGGTGESTTSFYFSTNTTLDSGDTALGDRAVVALASGATSSGSTSVTIPAGTATGTYYLLVKADAGNGVGETNESNNVAVRSIQLGPDLIISVFSAPSTAAAGATLSLSDTTKNQGGGGAEGSTTSFYFSTNATLDSGDTLLGSRTVPALGSGVSNAGSVIVTLPTGLSTGIYYLLAKTDDGNGVGETNESNNVAVRTITIN